MTDAKRGAMLLLLGLFTAVLLYPALHEGGHILVTLLLGGRIREVRLGAAASVLCGGLRHGELAAVAFGGVGLPLVLAMLLRPKHFPLWYVVQLVKGISVLAHLSKQLCWKAWSLTTVPRWHRCHLKSKSHLTVRHWKP